VTRPSLQSLKTAGCLVAEVREEAEVREALPYISPETFVLVPTAHALLRGVTFSLFDYALRTPVTTVDSNNPVVFNTTQRRFVQVGMRSDRHK
jgi:hypothetical protein